MAGSARALALALAVITFASVRAYASISSRDNILRIQLWDAEGLSREPVVRVTTTTERPTTDRPKKLRVDVNSLYDAMLQEAHPGGYGRFTRHKVRHKRRRGRQAGTEPPWRFHAGERGLNVLEFEDDVPWSVIEAGAVDDSAVSESEPEPRDVGPPMTLRQPQDEEEEVKQMPAVVPKCCPSGQNLTITFEDGSAKTVCSRTSLSFAPVFHQANETHIFSYESNVYETIVGNPCIYERYKLEPDRYSEDEFYLLVNGSLFVPYSRPYLLGTKDFCMETFYNETNPAGVTLPMVCFKTPLEETKTSATLIAYATVSLSPLQWQWAFTSLWTSSFLRYLGRPTGLRPLAALSLLISVPFLLATASVYLFIIELRDTHGKALACHTICLAIAFTCLATTQLAGHAFPASVCTIMAYLIQFSFVSCFFWLNVMSFDIFLNVRRYINSSVTRRSMRRRFAWYSAYAILLPIILLIITITMDLSPAVPSTYLKPNFGVKGCWFKTDQAALPYFYGPVAVILLSNLIIFFLTSRAFAMHYDKLKDVTPLDMAHSDFSTSDDWVRLGTVLGQPISVPERPASPRENHGNFTQRLKKYRKIFRTSCMLSVIMGLSWVLEVVSWAAGAGTTAVSVWSVFDLINALQGVVIFAIFVLQQPVRTFVKNSKLFRTCGRKRDGSEVSVVSERNSIINSIGPGRRDYV